MADPPRSPPGEGPSRPPSALLLPPALVLAVALLGSISVHLPIYAGLGELASLLASEPAPRSEPVEMVFLEAVPSDRPSEPEPESEPEPVVRPTPEEEEAPPAPTPRRRRQRPEPEPERTPEPEEPEEPRPVEPPPVVIERPPPPPPPPEIDERRAIVQQSDEPPEEPDDAQFIADQARDVEEQTRATVTNTQQDQPDPSAGAVPSERESEEEGDSDDEVVADLRDVEGDDRRVATPIETERRRPRETAEPDPSTSPTPGVTGGESLDTGDDAQPREGPRVESAEGGARAVGGGSPPVDEVIVSDGFGTFTIRRPRETVAGQGEGEAGGTRVEGPGRGTRGAGALAGRAGRSRGGAREGRAESRAGGPQLGLSWSHLEAVYGEEELRREREARLEERRSHSRGASRARRWEEFRAAIENYVTEVRPGNQTALDAAMSPFATFLSDMHRRIHREFADRYLPSLGTTEGLSDPSLATTLEISVNPDGTIHRVGIVATSGNTLFDFGAFNAVMRAQPFPRPPGIILSGDGHAWLHWRFDRGPRQCGTWNARPFMLENAPLVDRGEPPRPGEPDDEEPPDTLPARPSEEPSFAPTMPGLTGQGG